MTLFTGPIIVNVCGWESHLPFQKLAIVKAMLIMADLCKLKMFPGWVGWDRDQEVWF